MEMVAVEGIVRRSKGSAENIAGPACAWRRSNVTGVSEAVEIQSVKRTDRDHPRA